MRFTWCHALLVVVCLVPFVYAMQFAFPVWDDFDRAVKARYLFDVYEGLHEMLRAWWKWSGRYTHHFLVVFLGDLSMSQVGYTAGAFGLALTYGIGFTGLFATLSASNRPADWGVPGLLALFAVYGGMQDLASVAYVLTDVLGIGIGSALVVWFLWGLCRLWYADKIMPSHLWFPAITGVLAIGCYEHSALATLIAMMAAWALARYCGHPHQSAFSRLGLIICIAFALSFFTRGNFRRQTKRGMDMAVILPQLLRAWQDWLGGVGLYLHSIFPLAGLAFALAVSPRKRAGLRPVPGIFIVVGGLCAGLALSMGITLVHAVSDVPLIWGSKLTANLALLGGILTAAVLVPLCGPLRAACQRCMPGLLFVGVVLGGIIVFAPNTLRTLAALTSGETAVVYREYLQRMQVVAAAAGTALDIAPLSSSPYPTRTGEPFMPTADAWPNPHAARMYGLQAVRAVAADFSADMHRANGGEQSPTKTSGGTTGEIAGSTGTPVPGLGTVRLMSVAGSNATYAATWMIVEPEAGTGVSGTGASTVPGTLDVLVVAAPGPGRLLPIWLQRILLGDQGSLADLLPRDMRCTDLAAQAVLTPDLRTRFFAFVRSVPTQVVGPVAYASVHPLAGGAVTLFVSGDQGRTFTRIGAAK